MGKSTKGRWQRREGVMLCHPMDDKKLARALNYGAYVQPKLNGIRARAVWDDVTHSYHLVSSENNLITSMPHIQLALNDARKLCEDLGKWGFSDELDGELYKHGWPLERINGLCSKKKPTVDCYSIEFHCFDVVNEMPQQVRLEQLTFAQSVWAKLPSELSYCLKSVPSTLCQHLHEVWDAYATIMVEGVEGIIVRASQGLYVRKRSHDALKFKPKKKDWYRIAQVLEAFTSEGIPLGRAGSFICQNEGEKPFRIGMGFGISHDVAQMWWDNRFELDGKFAEVEYQELTDKNGVPRFGKVISISDRSYEERLVNLTAEVSDGT